MKKNIKWVKLGKACIDSGQILIIDPCYLTKEDVPYRNEDVDYKNPKNIYDRCCKKTLKGIGGEIVASDHASAIAIPTNRDGICDVYVGIKNNLIMEILIKL